MSTKPDQGSSLSNREFDAKSTSTPTSKGHALEKDEPKYKKKKPTPTVPLNSDDLPGPIKEGLRSICQRQQSEQNDSEVPIAVMADQDFFMTGAKFLFDSMRKTFNKLPGSPPSLLLEGGYYIILPKSVAKAYGYEEDNEGISGWQSNTNYTGRQLGKNEEYVIEDWGGSRLRRFPLLMKGRSSGKDNIRAVLYVIGLVMIVEVIPCGKSSKGEGDITSNQNSSVRSKLGCSLMTKIVQLYEFYDGKGSQKTWIPQLQFIYKLQMLGFALVLDVDDEATVLKEIQSLCDQHVKDSVPPFIKKIIDAVDGDGFSKSG